MANDSYWNKLFKLPLTPANHIMWLLTTLQWIPTRLSRVVACISVHFIFIFFRVRSIDIQRTYIDRPIQCRYQPVVSTSIVCHMAEISLSGTESGPQVRLQIEKILSPAAFPFIATCKGQEKTTTEARISQSGKISLRRFLITKVCDTVELKWTASGMYRSFVKELKGLRQYSPEVGLGAVIWSNLPLNAEKAGARGTRRCASL